MLHQPFGPPAMIFIVLALPLVLGLIPPNRFYGVRTRATLASPEVWRKANRVGGWGVLASSVFYLLVARDHPHNPDDVDSLLLHLAAFVFPLILSLVMAGRFARRLK